MARLSNCRQERFAQLISVSVPAPVAYLQAGFEGGDFAHKNASKLRNKPKIKARVAELSVSDPEMVAIRRAMLDEFYVACIKVDRLALVSRIVAGGADDLSPVERELIEGRQNTKYGTNYIMPKKLEAAEKLARLHGLDRPTKVAATDSEGNDAPITDEQRVMALAAILAKVQAENAAAEAAQTGGSQ